MRSRVFERSGIASAIYEVKNPRDRQKIREINEISSSIPIHKKRPPRPDELGGKVAEARVGKKRKKWI